MHVVNSWPLPGPDEEAPENGSGPPTAQAHLPLNWYRTSRSAATVAIPKVVARPRRPRRRWRTWHTVVITAALTLGMQAVAFVTLAVVYFPAPAVLTVQAHTGLG